MDFFTTKGAKDTKFWKRPSGWFFVLCMSFVVKIGLRLGSPAKLVQSLRSVAYCWKCQLPRALTAFRRPLTLSVAATYSPPYEQPLVYARILGDCHRRMDIKAP
jgi:hypothetical protein